MTWGPGPLSLPLDGKGLECAQVVSSCLNVSHKTRRDTFSVPGDQFALVHLP